MSHKSKALMLTALSASLLSLSLQAGTMGPIVTPSTYLLLEAGGAYTHSFYKDSIRTAESITLATPNGVSINPSHFYPDDFGGGYIEASLLRNMWLFNVRYDMFASETKVNTSQGTSIELAPVKLSFSVDKLWGSYEALSYGIGAGAVVATVNKGESILNNTSVLATNGQVITAVLGESIQGRTRIDPLVEALAMYQISPNFNIRLNVAYQIPVNSTFTDGSLNTNLGINIAFPI